MRDWIAQYDCMQTGTAWVVSPRDRLAMRGQDAVQVLHNLCTNEVSPLLPGQGCEAFVCSVQGKTLGHIWVFRVEDGIEIDAAPSQAATLIPHLDRYVIREDVSFDNQSESTQSGLLVGPQAATVLGTAWPSQKIPTEPLRQELLSSESAPSWIRSLPWGANVFQVIAPTRAFAAIESRIIAAGATPAVEEAWNAFRIEQGLPIFGRDILEDNLPQEVGRDSQAISFDKGCYLGQETVARIDARGHVNRTLCGMRFDGVDPPVQNLQLKRDEVVVGSVTSSCYSPLLNAPLALGYLRREHSGEGEVLASDDGTATILRLPLTPAV